MFKSFIALASVAILAVSTLAISGCQSSDNTSSDNQPYGLTGDQQTNTARYTNDKGQYHPEWQGQAGR